MAVQNYSESEREDDLHAFERLSENSVWETLCLTASRKTGQKILIVTKAALGNICPGTDKNDRGPKLPIAFGFSCVSKTFTIWQTVLTFSASESKNYTAFDRFHGNSRSVWQNPYQERTNQNVRIYLKTNTLPCIIKSFYKTQTELKKATNLLQIHRLRDKCPINIYTKYSKGEIQK